MQTRPDALVPEALSAIERIDRARARWDRGLHACGALPREHDEDGMELVGVWGVSGARSTAAAAGAAATTSTAMPAALPPLVPVRRPK